MKNLSILISLSVIIVSCTKSPDNIENYNPADNGVFIVNEGNFGNGTGSLSFYSYNTDRVYNNLFQYVNGWPLGNVAFSMNIKNELAYIVVNNSGKIEVFDKHSLKSKSTINGLNSPRYLSIIDNDKGYVTSMYSDSVAIINLNNNTVSGYINIRRSSEAIVTIGDKAYVSSWVGGKEIMIINSAANTLTDSIEVGSEPESMVIDKNNMLWVLCSGGWAFVNGTWQKADFSRLFVINTNSNSIVKEFVFNSKNVSPSSLQIDGTGETLYYLDNGVRKMDIGATELPSEVFIPESGHFYYKISINPVNSDIFLTDALDYQQQGNVLYYKKDGTLVSTLTADIIPGLMCFKLNDNFLKE